MPTPKKTQTAKPNPARPKMVTVRLPREMPAGLEYHYDAKFGEQWRIKTKKGLRAFFDLIDSGAFEK
ncbi:hypothetical protein [Holophaga foetida]|uniref:hypothetical protein n=1 Tax=Holophaga foetida TaxID=35839 RepID=UPI0002474958|nr:hypothetical protein [Holophaga foetida]